MWFKLVDVLLKRNIISSYLSQGFIVIVGIVVLPFYISLMGAEAYGLIGFFTMMQTLFAMLDMGLSPTIARETSRFRAGVHSHHVYIQLYRTLHVIFIVIGFVGFSLIYFSSFYIANKWLNINELGLNEVVFTIKLMAIIVALRWITGLYKGVISGYEEIVWLSGFNSFIAFSRFLIVFPVMLFFGATPKVFFIFQLAVTLFEFFGLLLKSKKLQSENCDYSYSGFDISFSSIKPHLKFALSFALSSGLWVLVTQIDKLIMSKTLSLEDYGYFTLAVLVASGIMMIGGPVSTSILPRMSVLEAEGNRKELINVYRNSTQIVTIIAGTVSLMFIFFSKQILFVWTGNKQIINIASPILQLYSAGYGLIVIGAFPYYLQYAIGNMKLHVIGSFIFVSILLPLLWYCTTRYGLIGAGYSWFIVNLLFFTLWPAYIHSKYIKGVHLRWLFNDVLKLLLLPVLVCVLLMNEISSSIRLFTLFQLILAWFSLLFFSALLSDSILFKIKKYFKNA